MIHKPTTVTECLSTLGTAAAGLLFPSESDYPLTPYRWSVEDAEPSPEALLRAEGHRADTKVETWTVHQLFDPLLQVEAGAPEEERAEAERYRALVALLEKELGDLRVYRVGTIDIDVYILGQHPSGDWLGLKTRVVET